MAESDDAQWKEVIDKVTPQLDKYVQSVEDAQKEEARHAKMEQSVAADSEEEKLMVEAVRETALRMLTSEDKDSPDDKMTSDPLCDWLALCCLRYRRYDIRRAVDRLKAALLSRKNLGYVITIKFPEIGAALNQKHAFILPGKDVDGRLCAYWSWEYDVSEKSDIWFGWYLHWLMLKCLKVGGVDAQIKGITIIADLAKLTPKHNDEGFFHTLQKALPVRLNKMLLINPTRSAKLIVPVIKKVASAKLSKRIHLISSESELQKHLPPATILKEWGGECEFDREAWNKQVMEEEPDTYTEYVGERLKKREEALEDAAAP